MWTEDDPRARALSALSRFLVTDATLGDTLHRVAVIALDAIPGAAVAGMSILGSDGRATTAIYTDETSPTIDQAQYESGRGPCLDAWRTQQIIRIDAIEAGSERYPEFAEACGTHAIRSTLSLPLLTAEVSVGALNLYAPQPGAFTHDDEALGADISQTAAVVLANAGAYWDAVDVGAHLNEAMKSRAVIEQAKGMLMARSETLTPEAAFELLRRASQRENVKLREIANRIVNRQPLTSDDNR